MSTAVFVAASLGAGTALATPPEGCVGLPATPAAYVCITQFTPANAVPFVAPGSGQTYTIPEFCVFDCFGPTPITVPDVVVTEGSGIIATIVYNGSTYTVPVPSSGTVAQTVQQAQQVVSGAVSTALGVAGDAQRQAQPIVNAGVAGARLEFTGTMSIQCFGCGWSPGSLIGEANGVANGQPVVNGPVSGAFGTVEPAAMCPLLGNASGTMTLPVLGPVNFLWTRDGAAVVIEFTTATGVHGVGVGTFVVVGNPCGGPVTATIAGILSTVA
jgi:hypothetical protein